MCLGPNPVNMTWFANEAFVGVIMLKLSGLAPPGCMGAFESIPRRFIFLRLRTEDVLTAGRPCEDIQRLA